LPKRAALLRAPLLKQIVLEDWLIEHAPPVGGTHRPHAKFPAAAGVDVKTPRSA
jgi:hypothetical protein